MTDEGIKKSIMRAKSVRNTPKVKVYDLDAMPMNSELSVRQFSVEHTQGSRIAVEAPRGMTLDGYDNVGDAVAEMAEQDVENRAGIRILLPEKPLIAGELEFGSVILQKPRASDIVVYFYSDKPSIVALPESVCIIAGATEVEFPIMTSNPERAATSVTVRGMLPDESFFSVSISVRYNLGLRVR